MLVSECKDKLFIFSDNLTKHMYLCFISGQKILLNVPHWAFESVARKNITFIRISEI